MAMKCPNCGAENPEGKRFCSTCGVGFQASPMPYQQTRQIEIDFLAGKKTEKFIYRLFGGLSWLMVSLGTFLIAFGYLGLVDSSYWDSTQNSYNMIGYGIVVYAIAAVFVAINRFVKNP